MDDDEFLEELDNLLEVYLSAVLINGMEIFVCDDFCFYIHLN